MNKYLLELGRKIRAPVNLSDEPEEQPFGGIKQRIRQDATICQMLADEEYHADFGVRSLIKAVQTVEDVLVERHLDVNEEIVESDEVLDFIVDVSGVDIVANIVSTNALANM